MVGLNSKKVTRQNIITWKITGSLKRQHNFSATSKVLSHYGSSSETQGQIVRTRKSLNGRKNIYGTKESEERREEPLGTMSYQTSSKRSPPFWLLIGARKLGSPRMIMVVIVMKMKI